MNAMFYERGLCLAHCFFQSYIKYTQYTLITCMNETEFPTDLNVSKLFKWFKVIGTVTREATLPFSFFSPFSMGVDS